VASRFSVVSGIPGRNFDARRMGPLPPPPTAKNHGGLTLALDPGVQNFGVMDLLLDLAAGLLRLAWTSRVIRQNPTGPLSGFSSAWVE
jgi:hypothetical protein